MRTPQDNALFKLHRWLSYEVKSALAAGLIFILPYGLVITLLYVLMALFIPVMVVQLFRAQWFGWLGFFVVMMLSGWGVPRLVNLDPRMIQAVYSISIFVPFYFYCWVLRWVVGERVSEIRAMEAMRQMDAISARDQRV